MHGNHSAKLQREVQTVLDSGDTTDITHLTVEEDHQVHHLLHQVTVLQDRLLPAQTMEPLLLQSAELNMRMSAPQSMRRSVRLSMIRYTLTSKYNYRASHYNSHPLQLQS